MNHSKLESGASRGIAAVGCALITTAWAGFIVSFLYFDEEAEAACQANLMASKYTVSEDARKLGDLATSLDVSLGRKENLSLLHVHEISDKPGKPMKPEQYKFRGKYD